MNKVAQFRERLDLLAADPHNTALRVVELEMDRAELAAALREIIDANDDYAASLDGSMALIRYRWATRQARTLLARMEMRWASD